MEYSTFKFAKYMNKLNWISKKLHYFLVFFIILYPILFIFQEGADLTDVGFLAMSYQNFFDYLAINKFLPTEGFLSSFIGASWLKIFPNQGILGLQFFNLFFVSYFWCKMVIVFIL